FTSSVTLIAIKDAIILVDTGTLAYRQQVLDALAHHNIHPSDVTHIINTHFHLDHISNNTLFPNAKQISEHAVFDLKTGKCSIYHDQTLLQKHIPDGIAFFKTPGHFKGHCSVQYTENNTRYVMAGDIIREDIIRGDGFSANGVSPQFYKSMKLIFSKADVIIPGHGRIIDGTLFDELYSLVLNEFPKQHEL
ncbi:MBL fold metallo-hydrolase, partial [Candidatus Peregrinibacteria bacterium]|nr:MBL fold metallo-hydrolase [Candidatus Peregrinibacteria bacterium]